LVLRREKKPPANEDHAGDEDGRSYVHTNPINFEVCRASGFPVAGYLTSVKPAYPKLLMYVVVVRVKALPR
jgi:hypothetical protein